MVLSTEENGGQGHLLPGADDDILLISQFRRRVATDKAIPFLGPTCLLTPSQHFLSPCPAMLHQTLQALATPASSRVNTFQLLSVFPGWLGSSWSPLVQRSPSLGRGDAQHTQHPAMLCPMSFFLAFVPLTSTSVLPSVPSRD